MYTSMQPTMSGGDQPIPSFDSQKQFIMNQCPKFPTGNYIYVSFSYPNFKLFIMYITGVHTDLICFRILTFQIVYRCYSHIIFGRWSFTLGQCRNRTSSLSICSRTFRHWTNAPRMKYKALSSLGDTVTVFVTSESLLVANYDPDCLLKSSIVLTRGTLTLGCSPLYESKRL